MDLILNNKYDVIVIRFIKSGAIVQLIDGSTELIHLSNISNTFVSDPASFLDIGGSYEAICVEGKARPTELSLCHLNLRCNSKTDKSKPAVHKHKTKEAKSANLSITAKPSSADNLDKMIEKANKAYEEKFPHSTVATSRPRHKTPRR